MIKPCYYKGERGNKPYNLELMLRLYLLQNLYNLSDEATVTEAIDSRAFSDFCGVDKDSGLIHTLEVTAAISEPKSAIPRSEKADRKTEYDVCAGKSDSG